MNRPRVSATRKSISARISTSVFAVASRTYRAGRCGSVCTDLRTYRSSSRCMPRSFIARSTMSVESPPELKSEASTGQAERRRCAPTSCVPAHREAAAIFSAHDECRFFHAWHDDDASRSIQQIARNRLVGRGHDFMQAYRWRHGKRFCPAFPPEPATKRRWLPLLRRSVMPHASHIPPSLESGCQGRESATRRPHLSCVHLNSSDGVNSQAVIPGTTPAAIWCVLGRSRTAQNEVT